MIFLLSVTSDRICAKVTTFHFALSTYVYERVNEGEFPTAEILSTSNTGSVPTETPKHRFPGILPARKQHSFFWLEQVVFTLQCFCVRIIQWVFLELLGAQLCLRTEVRNFLCSHSGRECQGRVGRWGGEGTCRKGLKVIYDSWVRQWWRLGEIARDKESRLGARRYWQVPGGGSTRLQCW